MKVGSGPQTTVLCSLSFSPESAAQKVRIQVTARSTRYQNHSLVCIRRGPGIGIAIRVCVVWLCVCVLLTHTLNASSKDPCKSGEAGNFFRDVSPYSPSVLLLVCICKTLDITCYLNMCGCWWLQCVWWGMLDSSLCTVLYVWECMLCEFCTDSVTLSHRIGLYLPTLSIS